MWSVCLATLCYLASQLLSSPRAARSPSMYKIALEQQAKLLDQLMGRERNLTESERDKVKLHFSDPKVDKYYLALGFSPHELFKNTKSDLGLWDLVCDEDCKREWDSLPQSEKNRCVRAARTHPSGSEPRSEARRGAARRSS